MYVRSIDINWHSGLPVFASEEFLRAVGDEYGWLGGFDDKGELLCVLPFTIVKKSIFRMVRFRVETIPMVEDFDVDHERQFLNRVVDYFRYCADMIIPASTNTIFRTYPDGADAAPYGSYVINLSRSEEELWEKMNRKLRQNINTAKVSGVGIRHGFEDLNDAYGMVQETFRRSKLPFMGFGAFKRYIRGLSQNGIMMVADYRGHAQSYVVFAYSDYCAYAIYAGNLSNQVQGANKLLYWEAIKHFRSLGVGLYDFVGTRINPEKGSKQAALCSFKKRFGAELKQGYLWKYPLNPLKYGMYRLASKIRSGGDIVDAERHKLADVKAEC